MYNIVFSLSDPSGAYYEKCMATIASVSDNTASEVCFHVVHDDTLSGQAVTALSSLCARLGRAIKFYAAPELPKSLLAILPDWFGPGTLYRLFLPQLLEPDVDTALYLDCDIIVNLAIEEIFKHDITKYYFAGVVDDGMMQVHAEHLKKIKFESKYINAGVLLINLKKLRENIPDFTHMILRTVEEQRYAYLEQDAINLYFSQLDDGILYLDKKYNFHVNVGENAFLPFARYQDTIIHYVGPKPWQTFSHAAIFYWKYYAEAFPQADVFDAILKTEPHSYIALMPRKWKRLMNRIRRLFSN